MRNFLRHLFVPHETNSHRAKILHVDSILIIIALLIFATSLLAPIQNKYPTVLGISHSVTIDELLNITNRIRQEHGLTTLSLNSELSQAAANKATDMFGKNYWAHIAPDGVTPWVFIKNSGYDYLYAGENLARGFTNATEAVNAWMASPSHRDNMLSANYKEVGFAVATGNLSGSDTVLIVEMFGTRFNEKVEAQQPITIAKITSTPAPPVASAVSDLIPSSQPVAILSVIPTPELTQAPPTIIPATPSYNNDANRIEVAAIRQQPLIDKNDFTKNIIFSIFALLIIVLAFDAFIIERKKIIRAVSHNLDHIIYLSIIILIIIIMGKGSVL